MRNDTSSTCIDEKRAPTFAAKGGAATAATKPAPRLFWLVIALSGCSGEAMPAHEPSPASAASATSVGAGSPASAAPPAASLATPSAPLARAECPAGTRVAGPGCAANAETTCPAGYQLELGVGCLVAPSDPSDDAFRAAMTSYQAWLGAGPKPGTGPEARGRAFGALQRAWSSSAAEPRSKIARVEIASKLAELLKVGDERDAPLWFQRTIDAYRESGAPKGTRPAELAAGATYFLAERQAWDAFDFDTGHLRVTETDARALQKLDAAMKDGERITAVFAPLADPSTFGSYRWAVEALARQASVTRSLVHAHLYVLSAGPTGDVKVRLETATALLREEEARRLAKALSVAREFGVSLPVLASVDKRLAELEKVVPAARFRAAAGK